MKSKIEKILLTCFLITLFFPMIFTKKIPNSLYVVPSFELFPIPITFLILFLIYQIWKPEKHKP